MSAIPPSAALLSKYNSEIQNWSNDVINKVPDIQNIQNFGIPKWVQRWPRVHKIVGPLLTWMPMIMSAGTVLGMSMGFGLHSVELLAVGGLCFAGALLSLPFIEVNEKQWCDVKYDWDAWQNEANVLIAAVKNLNLNPAGVESAIAHIALELRTGPLNSYQEPAIDNLLNDLRTIVSGYKKEHDEYTLNAIESLKNMTVSVQTPSILDNFGQGMINTQLHREQQG